VNFYGHFSQSAAAKQFRVNQAHSQALREDAARRTQLRPPLKVIIVNQITQPKPPATYDNVGREDTARRT